MTTDTIEQLLSQDSDERAKMAATYHALCDARDAAYERAAPLQQQLDAAIAATQAAQAEELRLAAEIEAVWGPHWSQLKRRIAELARSLVKIPPRA